MNRIQVVNYGIYVSLCVGSHSVGHDGSVLLSADLLSDNEVDYAVDELINQLNKARVKAKEEIRKINNTQVYGADK